MTRVLLLIASLLAFIVVGAMAGGVAGALLGWVLALGYHKRGPTDPGDAPIYVAIGLTMTGAIVGALVGLIIGSVYIVKVARKVP
jgi:hypothetical protein